MSSAGRIFLFHPVAFEQWGPDTPLEKGIGGSETSQAELAWRFARRGWEVTSYAPVPWEGTREWRGTQWAPTDAVDFTQSGVWLIYRNPEALDCFPDPHPGQRICFIAQDANYAGRWDESRIAKLDTYFALCRAQAATVVAQEPSLDGKVLVTSNGIRPEQFRDLDQNPPERDPYRLMWASSPDRGLFHLARIFRRLKEWVPKASLHVFYGFENIDKLIEGKYGDYANMKNRIMAEIQQPGIEWHGRIPQSELPREWAKSTIFCYPTSFTETSCISIMEAQAAGCVPVISPIWALAENIKAGGVVYGDPSEAMTQARFVGEIYRLLAKPDLLAQMRKPMMASARVNFNWERMVDAFENQFLSLPDNPGTHYTFQLKHAHGKVLNIGCDQDPCKFGERGATNVDITETNPVLGYKTAAHVIADVRQPLPVAPEYDTVILGDVIEHIREEEIPAAIRNAAAAVKPGGKLIVTFPDDTRSLEDQAMWTGANTTEHYAANSHALHDHRMDIDKVRQMVTDQGLAIDRHQDVDYGLYMGHALLISPNGVGHHPEPPSNRFVLYSPIHMEKWDWTNTESGIGGCETSIAEMAWRLAKLGHEVIVYTTVPFDGAREWRGTSWRPVGQADFSLSGTWVLYRSPDTVHKLTGNQQKWLMMQDWDHRWNPGVIQKLDRILVLCERHKTELATKHPELADKLWVTSNGVKVDLIREIEAEGLTLRDPYRVMFASSPDRGLANLLEIFAKAQIETQSRLQLHVFYGFDGVEKLVELYPQNAAMLRERDAIQQRAKEIPGVYLRGRVSQRTLYREWLMAGLWVYPSEFKELSCITAQEAQCMGAIPIVTDAWAQGENTVYGKKIPGDPSDPRVQEIFVYQLHQMARDHRGQERIRREMRAEARERCDWDRFAQQWSAEVTGAEAVTKCRSCGYGTLIPVLDLGTQAMASVFPDPGVQVPRAPLQLVRCAACDLGQLGHTVDRKTLFTGDYGYRSGMNQTMRDHLAGIARSVVVKPGDIVVDIGSNDGTLLDAYPSDVIKVGFEPSEVCRPDHIRAFFSQAEFENRFYRQKAKVVTSIAMFYDLDNPLKFAEEIYDILDADGTWIIELQDFARTARLGAFDTICHEHLTYWDSARLTDLLNRAGFVPILTTNDINGGSLRATCRKGWKMAKGNPVPGDWAYFKHKAQHAKESLVSLLIDGIPASSTVWGYGASTKGNVLLQYCGIGGRLIAIADRNPAKWGKLTPGTLIPIVSEDEMRAAKPDYLLALPWAFIDEFQKREPWATFIVPFPEAKILRPVLDMNEIVAVIGG